MTGSSKELKGTDPQSVGLEERAMGWSMGECTDKGCKERLEETHEAVFKDEDGGCRWDIAWLKKNIIGRRTAWAFVWGFVVVVGIPSYVTFINVWAGDKAQQTQIQSVTDRQAKVMEVNERQDARLIRLEEQFCTIKEEIKGVKEQQRSDTKEILESIRRLKE